MAERVDILVINAAASVHKGPIEDAEDWMFDKMFAANIRGALWLTDRACPDMASRQDGGRVRDS